MPLSNFKNVESATQPKQEIKEEAEGSSSAKPNQYIRDKELLTED